MDEQQQIPYWVVLEVGRLQLEVARLEAQLAHKQEHREEQGK